MALSDYSNTNNWLSLPSENTFGIDVFYIYPSCYFKVNDEDPLICHREDPRMRRLAKGVFERQATVFEPICNLYAPYYRQVDPQTVLWLPHRQHKDLLKRAPYADICCAFDFYIKHLNAGRPFILAGHSQGAEILLDLLAEKVVTSDRLYQQLVAAYAIGYSVTEDYLAQNTRLKFAENADDTGVIISYNTEAPGITEENPVVLAGAQVINPVNWRRDTSYANRLESVGARLRIHGQFVSLAHFADAQIDPERGTLLCSTADASALYKPEGIFPKGVYHNEDYVFYYYDLRENAKNRICKYLEKQENS